MLAFLAGAAVQEYAPVDRLRGLMKHARRRRPTKEEVTPAAHPLALVLAGLVVQEDPAVDRLWELPGTMKHARRRRPAKDVLPDTLDSPQRL